MCCARYTYRPSWSSWPSALRTGMRAAAAGRTSCSCKRIVSLPVCCGRPDTRDSIAPPVIRSEEVQVSPERNLAVLLRDMAPMLTSPHYVFCAFQDHRLPDGV